MTAGHGIVAHGPFRFAVDALAKTSDESPYFSNESSSRSPSLQCMTRPAM
jgi:hypothetical protein